MNDWQDRAACKAAVENGTAAPSWWFPTRHDAGGRGGGYTRARAICASCVCRVQCLEQALAYEADAGRAADCPGMFGGKTPEQRLQLVRERRRRAVAV